MKCPNCKVKLERTQYEGVNIETCGQCKGSLVRKAKETAIKNRREKTKDDLLSELVASDGADTTEKIRCPRCLSNMQKRTVKLGDQDGFITDTCKKCELVWLDEGEIAKVQIAFEFSVVGQQQHRFQDRLKNMTPEEKQIYEDRIASLPEKFISVQDMLLAAWLVSLF